MKKPKYKKDKVATALRRQRRAEKPVEKEVRMGKVLRMVIPFEAPLVAVKFYDSPDAPGSMEIPVDALDETELPCEQPIDKSLAERAIREEAIAERRRGVIIEGAQRREWNSPKASNKIKLPTYLLDGETPSWIRQELGE